MATVAEVALEVTQLCNASPGVYGVATDKFRLPEEIEAAVVNGDRAVSGVILDTKGHRSRNRYLRLKDVADGEVILNPAGNDTFYQSFEGGVLINSGNGYTKATPLTEAAFKPLKENPNVLATSKGYYNICGLVLTYLPTTSPAKCEVIDIGTFTFGTTIQSPEEYIGMITRYAMSELTKYGAFVQAAAHHFACFNAMAQLIRQGQVVDRMVSPFRG